MKVIDARGLSCPEPLLLLQNAVNSKENSYKLLATCPAARENVLRYGQKLGFTCEVKQNGEELEITLTK
ncbi:MAG: sulfurtransferase TusA family protein [Eubacteriales bacterium]|nr:sulfurtransferase TusA family protein [Eubacteriales bacterium]